MAIDYEYFENSKNPKNWLDDYMYMRQFRKENPDYFVPEGITIFCGSQGEGKTLSAVELCKNILREYPKAIFCTNLDVIGIYNKTIEFTGLGDFEEVENGTLGVVYLVDEIHTYLNSLLSRQIPLSTITSLSQQRKQRKLIIGTSQVYTRMAKPLREQVKNVVLCSKKFLFVQDNKLIDSMNTRELSNGELKFDVKRRFWWFHTPLMYKSYDTSKVQHGLTKPPENNVVVINS